MAREVRKLILATPAKAEDTLKKMLRQLHDEQRTKGEVDSDFYKLFFSGFELLLKFYQYSRSGKVAEDLEGIKKALREKGLLT